MQNAQQQQQQQQSSQDGLEMNLRETLLREGGAVSGSAPYPPPPAPTAGASHPYPPQDHPGSPQSHQHHHQIDPNVAGAYDMATEPQHMDDGSDRGKGKRELSTSKRAAQNRAAQRAFRQRKEGYIKKLEEQVKEYSTMEHNYKALQNENYQLREYILSLQSRLLENQAEFPPAPAHANLQATAPPQQNASPQEPSYGAEQQLRREIEQPRAPPPAPVVAQEDPAERLSQLTQAATEARQPQTSPYGIAGEYPSSRPDTGRRETSGDAKPAE